MEALYAEGELTVNQFQEKLPDPPTPMAIRAMLKILVDKGLVKRRKISRGYLYRPKALRNRIGQSRLQKVVQTFFDGSIEKAVGAYLADGKSKLTQKERDRLRQLIDEADKTTL